MNSEQFQMQPYWSPGNNDTFGAQRQNNFKKIVKNNSVFVENK